MQKIYFFGKDLTLQRFNWAISAYKTKHFGCVQKS